MGTFINFHLAYKDSSGNRISSEVQARLIITEAQKRIASGASGVSITYSANFSQTTKIHQVYDVFGWNTHTSGANQADVIQAMERLMASEYTALQGKLRIAPITTISKSVCGDAAHMTLVAMDLEYIKDLLDDGIDILGWMNQDSTSRYAVGGGIIAALPANIEHLIQSTLNDYHQGYSNN